jgi:hypothetical protein
VPCAFSTDGTASLANREIGRMLPANYREVPFSDAVEHPNEAAIARYFDDLSGDFPETGTRWRSEMDSNSRFHWFRTKRADFCGFSFSARESERGWRSSAVSEKDCLSSPKRAMCVVSVGERSGQASSQQRDHRAFHKHTSDAASLRTKSSVTTMGRPDPRLSNLMLP